MEVIFHLTAANLLLHLAKFEHLAACTTVMPQLQSDAKSFI